MLHGALALRKRQNVERSLAEDLRIAREKIEAEMDRPLDEPGLHDESIRYALHMLKYRQALSSFQIDRTSMPQVSRRARCDG